MALAWQSGRRAARIGLIGAILGIALIGAAPATSAADAIQLTTPYPAVAVAPGAKVSFDVSIKTPSRPAGQPVAGQGSDRLDGRACAAAGSSSTASRPTARTPTEVTLEVTVPADATAGSQRITITASGGGTSTTLALDIRVTPSAAGDVTLTTQFPQLKGVSTTNFSFSLTPDQRHVGRPDLRRRGRRPGRLDRHRRGRLAGAGGERRRQGRRRRRRSR